MASVLDIMLHYIIICIVVPAVLVQVHYVKRLENDDLENGYLENKALLY